MYYCSVVVTLSLFYIQRTVNSPSLPPHLQITVPKEEQLGPPVPQCLSGCSDVYFYLFYNTHN